MCSNTSYIKCRQLNLQLSFLTRFSYEKRKSINAEKRPTQPNSILCHLNTEWVKRKRNTKRAMRMKEVQFDNNAIKVGKYYRKKDISIIHNFFFIMFGEQQQMIA